MMKCQKCGHKWPYKGKRKFYTICPNCRANVKIKKVEEDDRR